MLERISGFTVEEAKQYLISQVEGEVTHEAAVKIKEIEQRRICWSRRWSPPQTGC